MIEELFLCDVFWNLFKSIVKLINRKIDRIRHFILIETYDVASYILNMSGAVF